MGAREEKEEGTGEVGVLAALATDAAGDGDKEEEGADETALSVKETVRGAVEIVFVVRVVFLRAGHLGGAGAAVVRVLFMLRSRF